MIITLVLRFLQLVFAAVVIGASVSLARGQIYGSVPAAISYSAFAGSFGVLVALVGIASIWIERKHVAPIVDGLAAIFFVAGGVAFAVSLHGVSCSSISLYNTYPSTLCLLGGGCEKAAAICNVFNYNTNQAFPWVIARCKLADVDTAFLFLAFAVSGLSMLLGIFQHKRGGGRENMI